MTLQNGAERGRGAECSLRRGLWLCRDGVTWGRVTFRDLLADVRTFHHGAAVDRKLCEEAEATVPAEVAEAWARRGEGGED